MGKKSRLAKNIEYWTRQTRRVAVLAISILILIIIIIAILWVIPILLSFIQNLF